MSEIRLNKDTYCQIFVSPGMGATLQDFFDKSVFMTELLPTFGYPMTPTDICFLSSCSFPNCRRRLIRAPFPKACVMEAWKAIVGLTAASSPIQRLATQEGTKSTLL